MKKIIFLATTLLMVLAFTTQAQERQQRERLIPEQQATRTVEQLNKELTLTEKQQTDLKKWYTDSYTQRAKNMEKNRDNREAMRETMKKDRESTEAQLKKVLTEDQFKKYQENEKKRMEQRQNRGGQRGQGMGQGGQRGGGQGGQGGQGGGNRPW